MFRKLIFNFYIYLTKFIIKLCLKQKKISYRWQLLGTRCQTLYLGVFAKKPLHYIKVLRSSLMDAIEKWHKQQKGDVLAIRVHKAEMSFKPTIIFKCCINFDWR